MNKSVLAGAAAALLLAATPTVAQARDPLAGGTTTLKLDAGVAKALKSAGVKVSGTTYKITGGLARERRGDRHDRALRQPAPLGRRQVADRLELHRQAREALDAQRARRR